MTFQWWTGWPQAVAICSLAYSLSLYLSPAWSMAWFSPQEIDCFSTYSTHLCSLCREHIFQSLLNIMQELKCYSWNKCDLPQLQRIFNCFQQLDLSFKIDASGRLFFCLAIQCFRWGTLSFCSFLWTCSGVENAWPQKQHLCLPLYRCMTNTICSLLCSVHALCTK